MYFIGTWLLVTLKGAAYTSWKRKQGEQYRRSRTASTILTLGLDGFQDQATATVGATAAGMLLLELQQEVLRLREAVAASGGGKASAAAAGGGERSSRAARRQGDASAATGGAGGDFEVGAGVASEASAASYVTDSDTTYTSVSAVSRQHTASSPFQDEHKHQSEVTAAAGRGIARGSSTGKLGQELAAITGAGADLPVRGLSEAQQQLRPMAPRAGLRRSRSASDDTSSSSSDEDDEEYGESAAAGRNSQQAAVRACGGAVTKAPGFRAQHELTALAAAVANAATGAGARSSTPPPPAAAPGGGYGSRLQGNVTSYGQGVERASQRSNLENQQEQEEAAAYGLVIVGRGGRVVKRHHRGSLPGDFREQEPGVDPKDGAAVYVHQLPGRPREWQGEF